MHILATVLTFLTVQPIAAYAYLSSSQHTSRSDGLQLTQSSALQPRSYHAAKVRDVSSFVPASRDLRSKEPQPTRTFQLLQKRSGSRPPLFTSNRRGGIVQIRPPFATTVNDTELSTAIATGAPIYRTFPIRTGDPITEDSILWSTSVGQDELDGFATTNLEIRITNVRNQGVVFIHGDGFNGFRFVTGIRFAMNADYELVWNGLSQALASGRIVKVVIFRPDDISGIDRSYYLALLTDIREAVPLPPGGVVSLKYRRGLLPSNSRYVNLHEFWMTVAGSGTTYSRIFDTLRGSFVNPYSPSHTT